MKRLILFAGVLALAVGISCGSADIRWQCVGRIKARSASEISGSNFSVGAETMDRDYTVYENWREYLGPLGIKKARIQAGWAKTEKAEGRYDWAWLDKIIHDMVGQGVEPWVCLCYGNSLYAAGGGERLGAALPRDEKALKAWLRFVGAMVERYEAQVDEWEVWNEPNLRGANAASHYARVLIRTAETIREIQPEAKILAMSVAGVNHKFVGQVLAILAEKGKLDLVDEVTYHPYKRNPDDSYSEVEKLRAVVKSYSEDIGIRQGENGAPSEYRRTKALSRYDWTELSQAKWALRRLLGDLGRDIPSSYFAIMDMKYPDEINRKGLLKADEDKTVERPKQAYYAVQNLASVFDNSLARIERFEYEAKTKKSLSVFAYRSRKSGQSVVTIWFDSDTPSDSNARTAVDFEFENVSLERPMYVDLRTGAVHRIADEDFSQSQQSWRFAGVPCYDSPVLIADASCILVQRTDER